MFENLNPSIIFIDGKYINMENVVDYRVEKNHLFILLDYYFQKEILRFGSIQEMNKAIVKIENALKSMDYGVNHG